MKIIILAGGKGTRLWPVSRNNFPKQFLNINGKTLLRRTIDRSLLLEKPENIYISTNKKYLNLTKEELKQTKIPLKNIITEPFSKNTGPAIFFALLKLEKELKEDELIFVCPSDHYISPEKVFAKNVFEAQKVASLNNIVTFGIKPTFPETGYGYIEMKDSLLKSIGKTKYYQVNNFIEKPNLKKAKQLLSLKRYYWNSGMFLFPFKLIKEEFEKAGFTSTNLKKIDPISIDKAIIEKSNKVTAIATHFDWNDIGSWNAFYQVQKKDKEGNAIQGNVLSLENKNSLIISNKRLVACLGLKDITVIETEDAIFVAPINRSQEIKLLIEKIETKNKNIL